MTQQEQQMIDGLIDRVRNTQVTDRDPEAAAHLQQGLGANPDAIYILAQTVLVQQQALLTAQTQLQSANQQIAQLRDAAGHPPQQPSGSWLDRFFGSSSSSQPQVYAGQPPAYPPPAYSAPTPQQPPYGAPMYAPAPPQQQYPPQPYPPQGYAQPGYPQPAYGYGGQPAGGSFLRNAAQTAAGVAAGALLFEGVESMFGGHGGGGFGGGGYGHEGTTINNYYEDRPQTEHHAAADTDSSFYNPSNDASRDLSPDVEDRRGFADDSSTSSDNFDTDTPDTGSDSSSFDDTSSADDSSSFDSGDSGGGDGSF